MNQREFKGVWIPKEIYLADIPWTAKIIFLEIDSFTSQGKDCFISNEHLADFVGISVSQVSRSIKQLMELGWIEQTRFDGRKRYLQSRLRINADSDYASMRTQTTHECAGRLRKNAHIYKTNTKTNTKTSTIGEQIEIDVWPTFEDFLKTGLPQTKKAEAEKCWKKLSQKTKEHIINHASQYAQSNEKKFLAGVGQYLKNKIYEDEIINRNNKDNPGSLTAGSAERRIRQYLDEG